MRIALYARVSTQDQHPEAQLQPLREYAQRRGAEAVEFVDHVLRLNGQWHRRHRAQACSDNGAPLQVFIAGQVAQFVEVAETILLLLQLSPLLTKARLTLAQRGDDLRPGRSIEADVGDHSLGNLLSDHIFPY